MQSIVCFIIILLPLLLRAYYTTLFSNFMLMNKFDWENEQHRKWLRKSFCYMILLIFGSCLYEIIF